MRVTAAESTELFVGPADAPQQLVRVDYTGCAGSASLRVEGVGLSGTARTGAADDIREIAVAVTDPVPGERRPARVVVDGETGAEPFDFTFTVAEPGWTMFMIPHFHYDPVWWNTQGRYTSAWTEDPPGACRQTNGIDLVGRHLAWARHEPEYKFVLAEVDYLKPYWDTHPQHRAELRRLIAEGRVEVLGGSYNEPNTPLTGPETTIRNLVLGAGFQRDVLGADPATAWMLDVFGHDPQFPGICADTGLTASGWARGPYHQWGPMADGGDVTRMQFASEFEWIAPSGLGLLTHYMPAHYAAGWWMDSAASLDDAERAVYRLFTDLKKVAATRNVLLPVGTDFTPPNQWVVEIHRDWAKRYTWPRFVCALPSEFFAAVRAELAAEHRRASPQTRDMNPIYTGTHVSYVDTKQAHRAGENAVLEAERFAVFAALVSGADYPQAALAKAWTQLAYNAHHDSITGSESDQVYLDLLTGWRDAWRLGRTVRDTSLAVLSGAVGGAASSDRRVVVWNPLAHPRTDVVTARLAEPVGADTQLLAPDGTVLPAVVEDGGRSVTFLAAGVPSLGWTGYRLGPATGAAGGSGWEPMAGVEIGNEYFRVSVDPRRGGGVVSLVRLPDGAELITPGRVGNVLADYEEYPAHPRSGEGPWHLVTSGRVDTSTAATEVGVQAYRCPLGERLVVRGRLRNRFGVLLAYTQTLTLLGGLDRLDCRTTVDGFTGADDLLRLRWPCRVPGALPVSEVGDAVVGRGFALLHDSDSPDAPAAAMDTARRAWTLDNACFRWFGLSATARVRVGADAVRAVSVAEVVVATDAARSAESVRDLMVALVRAGVTATCGSADGPRYGLLDVDSNLPDARIALGGPAENAFTAAVLAAADPAYPAEVARQLAETGRARVWVPAAAPLAEVWRYTGDTVDLTGPAALPVLVVAGTDAATLGAELAALAGDLADAEIGVEQRCPAGAEPFTPRTVALVNRGTPSFAVEPDGTLSIALLRSCTGWPSASWSDPPRRTAPDGSAFQLMHWSHGVDYALVAGDGDWRAVAMPARAAEFDQPLIAVCAGPAAGAGLPASGSLLAVEPAGRVALGALKPAGNPLAHGSAAPVDPATVALRLVETHGAATTVTLRSTFGPVTNLTSADLLERHQPGRTGPTALHGYQIATLLGRLGPAQPARFGAAASAVLGPEAEADQPLYARYWLHNRGPAPLGGLPAVAHLHPHRVTTEPGTDLTAELTVASDSTDRALAGSVHLVCPAGWSARPATLPIELPPGGQLSSQLTVTVPAGAEPGLYPIRTRLSVAGENLPPSWRQPVEDVAVVCVGAVDPAGLLYLVDGPAEVGVRPGETVRLAVTVGTDAHADLPVTAELVSPWGTWEWVDRATLGTTLPANGTVELLFDVTPPVWARPGSWWALVKVGCAGALVYSPAAWVTVLAASDRPADDVDRL